MSGLFFQIFPLLPNFFPLFPYFFPSFPFFLIFSKFFAVMGALYPLPLPPPPLHSHNVMHQVPHFWHHILGLENFWILPLGRMLARSIQKFWVTLKIWLKINISDHSGSAMDENQQNPEILSHFENLAQILDFLPLLICERWNLAKFRNVELDVLKIWLRMKFCKIQKILSHIEALAQLIYYYYYFSRIESLAQN